MVVVVVEIGNQTVVWHLGAHRRGEWVSRRGWGDSSNWNCRYYHMGHWVVVACIILQYLHTMTSNPSLKEPLDTVLLGAQGIGNWCRDWLVQDFHSLPALHGAVCLQAPPPSLLRLKS